MSDEVFNINTRESVFIASPKTGDKSLDVKTPETTAVPGRSQALLEQREQQPEQVEASKYAAVEQTHFIATISLPIRLDHWYKQNATQPPMKWRMGVCKARRDMEADLIEAIKYGFQKATDGGKGPMDPDAVIQNALVALFGYNTKDGLEFSDTVK